jgi:hypothetical protein
MPTIGQQLDGLCYIAWNTLTNSGKTGDSGNHTLKLVKDGTETNPTNSPSEVDGLNCPGLYKITLTGEEMNAGVVTLAGISSTSNVIIVPVQLTTQAALSLTSYVLRRSPVIWTDTQLNQWSIDALGAIATDLNCIWAREAIPVTIGNSVIRLPHYVRTLQRVTWRGKSLDCVSWEEFCEITPGTVFLTANSAANIEIQGVPLFYAMHPTDPYEIRLYPSPNESLAISGLSDPYAPTVNAAACVIAYWRVPDTNINNPNPLISLPGYIQRRIQKAYVLWKAFAAEGKGQDLLASNFYEAKYKVLINYFRSINEGSYVSKRYVLGDGISNLESRRYPKPTLGSSFERVIF